MVTNGLGDDTSKTKCFFCGWKTSWCSNFPKYRKYTCEPCYLFAVKAPSKWKLVWKYFKNPIYWKESYIKKCRRVEVALWKVVLCLLWWEYRIFSSIKYN